MRKGVAPVAVAVAAGVAIAAAVGLGAIDLGEGDTGLAVERFASEQEFVEYVERAPTGGTGGLAGGVQRTQEFEGTRQSVPDSGGTGGTVERAGTTNVQETGVQEPDRLKYADRHFFYAPEGGYIAFEPVVRERGGDLVMPPRRIVEPNASVVSTLPTGNVSEVAEVPENGRMVQHGDRLVVFGDGGLHGYGISDPEAPEERWDLGLNGSVEAARRIGGDLYVVVAEEVDVSDPCPVVPMAGAGGKVTVPCTDVWHPTGRAPADTTYTVARVAMEDGAVEDTTTVVGGRDNSVVYMSGSDIYLTYTNRTPESEIIMRFLSGEGGSILDAQARRELRELQGYDLGREARMAEMQRILEDYRQRLPEDERQDLGERFETAFGNWSEDHRREFVSTGVVRVTTGLDVAATGTVPGTVNDRFSLDAREGNLRIATTVSAGFGAESANDLYVLDRSLDRVGAVQGMGLDERIYSVRYVNDTAYVVTFRRIDPFHVVDLSDPANPEVAGVLKLPGFSSYLHPIGEDRVLGIGEEDGQVKAVMFDVSDPADPAIEDSRVLDAYHSEVGTNAHAFMQDPKHEVVFLPASDGGHIYSYADGLERVMTVNITDPARARYVNDHLYVFGEREVAVVDETSWSVEARRSLRPERER